jgi:uncharacterized protein (TIGR03663 family)
MTIELTETRAEKLICAIFFSLALIAAFWLRFHQIGIKPFHHDEGVNSYFLLNLARNGEYRYDPTNYHGPTLYYLALISLRVFGQTDFALRFWPALFGVMTVAMVWFLRRHLGTLGTPVAAFCLALSPGLVYFSRDFIHEMSFGCFSLGIVIGALKYAETKEFVWMILLAGSAGLLFSTKETAIITAVILILALLCAAIWAATRKLIDDQAFSLSALAQDLKNDFVKMLPSIDHSLAGLIIFLFINIFFYTSLFTNWQGITDAFKSILLWSGRSGSEHVKSFWYYLGILLKLEFPMVLGSLLAGIFVILRGTRFWLFTAAWTLGSILAYSIIGYKTPWLMLSFLIPMAIISGYGAQQLYRFLGSISLRILWLAVMVTAMILCWNLTSKVNFEKYDDNNNSSGYFVKLGQELKLKPYTDGQYGYVYAQTDRDIANLLQEIKVQTDRFPTGIHTGIYIASPDYWPLPWYLRDYDKVAYTGGLNALPDQTPMIAQPIVVAHVNQQNILDGLPGWKSVARAFTLRPGVEIVLYLQGEEEGPK